MEDPITLANRLGLDYERKGSLARVVCPFHNDSRPSLALYKDHAHCYACGTSCSLAHLWKTVKGTTYKEAYESLGMEFKGEVQAYEREHYNFCSAPKYIKELTERYETLDPLPDFAISWLNKKGILETAQKEGWKYLTNQKIANWRDGIVIPYWENGQLAYLRFRKRKDQGFEKPISLPGVESRPKLPASLSDTVAICEGESDYASLSQLGYTAICVPGCMARKCINTALKFCEINGVKNILACGDNDEAGQKMNQLIQQTAQHLFPSLNIITLPSDFYKQHSDLNDYYVADQAGLKHALESVLSPLEGTESPNSTNNPSETVEEPYKARNESLNAPTEVAHDPTDPYPETDEFDAGLFTADLPLEMRRQYARYVLVTDKGKRYEFPQEKFKDALTYLNKVQGCIYSDAGNKIAGSSDFWFRSMPDKIDPIPLQLDDSALQTLDDLKIPIYTVGAIINK